MTALESRGRRGPPAARRAFLLVLLLGLCLRLGLLMAYGPRPCFDSIHEYVPYARMIAGGTGWMSNAGLSESAVPVTAFRMIGYPALIALADAVAGAAWPWLLVSLQIAASLLMVLLAMRLAAALAPDRPWAAPASGLLAACGQTLVSDTAIQTDSLSAAGLAAFAVLSALGALRRRALGPLAALGLGLLPAASFLLRENTDLTVLVFLPPALAWILRAAPAAGRRLLLALLVLAPLIAANAAVLSWNAWRSGSAFATTGPQVILLQALMHAAWAGAPVLEGDGLLERSAREVLAAKPHPDGFLAQDELFAVSQRLFEAGSDAVQISRRMARAYLEAWARHPLGMLQGSLGNLSGELFFVLGDSVRLDLPDLLSLPAGRADWASWGVALLLGALGLLLRGASLAVTLGFLLSPLSAGSLALAGRRRLGAADWFRLYALAAGLAFLALHAVVHFEDRFLAPVEPLAIVAGVTGIAEALGRPGRAGAPAQGGTGAGLLSSAASGESGGSRAR